MCRLRIVSDDFDGSGAWEAVPSCVIRSIVEHGYPHPDLMGHVRQRLGYVPGPDDHQRRVRLDHFDVNFHFASAQTHPTRPLPPSATLKIPPTAAPPPR